MQSHPSRFLVAAFVIAGFEQPAFGAAAGPDRVIFKNGREISGLIVKGDENSVTLRRGSDRVETFERKSIRRIDDTATTGAYFAASSQMLPPWNAIVNDLRTNESVHRLRLLTRGRDAGGPFAGIPYLVFEMNGAIELRVYGDPANPAGLQLGLRASKAGDRSERLALRAFFAGFLTQGAQISALYDLDMDGAEKAAGDLRIAFGTQREDAARAQWWMAAWNPAAMRQARHRDAAGDLASAHGWENGFQRDRDGSMRANGRVAALGL